MLLAAAIATVSNADIINVPGDQLTIQAGIDAAADGDEVVVAVGEYRELINFNGKAITVRSTDPADAGVVLNTIINGAGAGTVVTCESGEGSNTVLRGFVITGGSAFVGGGMANDASSPTVVGCTFSGNLADFIGGVMANTSNSSPTVTNCTFSENSADSSDGVGMSNSGGSPTVTSTGFCDNTPGQISGSYTDGGGNSLLYCRPPLRSCPADIDNDGMVGITDFLLVLSQWGPCP